ncbi:NUDIX domain-containing protein [Mobilisporobacter senegalensis]|uniref:NUDIX domain-containing protein n=1 Tax=Mobilisporobacter senegalensis TaxID=1329262 RepID=A0A3N1XPV2_9FIRM|nr:NUDIX domain-containing protein [Mobilisporobacter senegalensis]ROR28201.1 NUDIX domain-containing protein [Mobilisporobacter senegalensis]
MDKYRILVKGIVEYNDKYLIVEKWYDDRIMNPYQWGFIDGSIEFGEAPDKAVIRIINENTGINAEISKILYTWSFMVGEVCNIGISYLCLCSMDEVLLSEELHNYKWISKEEFKDYIDNKDIIDDIERAEL